MQSGEIDRIELDVETDVKTDAETEAETDYDSLDRDSDTLMLESNETATEYSWAEKMEHENDKSSVNGRLYFDETCVLTDSDTSFKATKSRAKSLSPNKKTLKTDPNENVRK